MDDFTPRSEVWNSQLPTVAPPAIADLRMSFTDIRSIFGVVLRHWKLIVAVPVVCVAIGIAILHFVEPLYRSTVELLVVDPRSPPNPADTRNLSTLDVDAAAVSSEVEILQSRSLALKVAKDQGLDKDPEFSRGSSLLADLQRLIFGSVPAVNQPLATAADIDGDSPEIVRAAEALRRQLSVERVQFSYALNVSVMSANPAKAQQLATVVANTYLNDQLEARYDAAKRATTWLTGRLDELRSRVGDTDAAIAKLKAQNGLTDTGTGSNVSQQQMSDINTQLVIARADEAEKKARYDQIKRAADSGQGLQSIPEVMASPVISQLRVQQADLSRRKTELQSRFGDRYPDVLNAESQLETTSRAINAEVTRIAGNVLNDYDIASQRVQSLEKSLATLTGQSGNSQVLVQLQELERVADSDRKLYEQFLNQFNEIDQRSTYVDSGARVISPAALPTEPASPRSILILSLVALSGLLGGTVCAFLVEYLDSGFKTGAQVEQALGYSLLGMVPRLRGGGMRHKVDRKEIIERAVGEPFSRLSESIRSVRMGVTLSDVDDPPRVILVTSAVPSEGKSTVASLLATSAAQANLRTVLVDCDLRRKSTSHAFGIVDQPGLIEILANKLPLVDATFQESTTKIAMIPAGGEAQNPPEMLSSQRMRDLIKQLRADYDLIVLDGSPLLPVIDSVGLARLADKTVIVTEWSRTPRASVASALKMISADSRRVAGIVLNKVDFSRMTSYGYGYGYGYNYGYHHRALDKYYTTSK